MLDPTGQTGQLRPRGKGLAQGHTVSQGQPRFGPPSFRFPTSLTASLPPASPRAPSLILHLRPGSGGSRAAPAWGRRTRPSDCLKMPRQGRRCSRCRSCKACRWCRQWAPGKIPAAERPPCPAAPAAPPRLTCSPSWKAGGCGRRRAVGLAVGSAVPRPGWGRTRAAHSLATGSATYFPNNQCQFQ